MSAVMTCTVLNVIYETGQLAEPCGALADAGTRNVQCRSGAAHVTILHCCSYHAAQLNTGYLRCHECLQESDRYSYLTPL